MQHVNMVRSQGIQDQVVNENECRWIHGRPAGLITDLLTRGARFHEGHNVDCTRTRTMGCFVLEWPESRQCASAARET